ncbi:hypothetical protein [Thiolapillus sp.]
MICHRPEHNGLAIISGIAACLLIFCSLPAWSTTTRLTESTTVLGNQASLESGSPSLSADGKLLVFHSAAPNLVPDDHNRVWDIFLRNTASGSLSRISNGMNGQEANGGSSDPVISADGRFVAFQSTASNLVPDDNNNRSDVFLYDIQSGTTTRISIDSNGNEANRGSGSAALSDNGRFVAFSSDATNLVANDNNGVSDIFLHDTQTGATRLVSVDSSGYQANAFSDYPAISGDGRYVAFTSVASNLVPDDTEGHSDIFVHDTQSGTTIRISEDGIGHGGNADTFSQASLSTTGGYIAFDSQASNLAPGAYYSSYTNVFLHDLQLHQTIVVSKDDSGNISPGSSFNPVISGDGKFVAYESRGQLLSNDVNDKRDIYLFDVEAGVNTLVSITSNNTQGNQRSRKPAISQDGTHVAFISDADNLDLETADANLREDIFLRDLEAATTSRQSLASNGPFPAPPNAPCCYDLEISADGRFVVFDSVANNLVSGDTNAIYSDTPEYYKGIQDIFVLDTTTKTPVRVNVHTDGMQSNLRSDHAAISADGRYVVFDSAASNLVDGDTNYATDVFLHDMQTRETIRISLDPLGNQLDASSATADISADGRFVVFISDADNLVTGDTNGVEDVFVLDRQNGHYKRVNISSSGTQVTQTSNFTYAPSISGDGRYVVFQSSADNLVSGDTNGVTDVFVHDLQQEKTWRVSVASSGVQADAQSTYPVISDDGRYIVFDSMASNLAPNGDNNNVQDVYRYDMSSKTIELVSQNDAGYIGNDHSNHPAISPDGRFVSFSSVASNLVTGDWNRSGDVFVRDMQTGTIARSSVNDAGTGGDDDSFSAAITTVGGQPLVAFASDAKNLTPDIGALTEVFLYQPGSCSSFSVLHTFTPITKTQHWQCGYLEATSGFEIGAGGYVTFEADSIHLGAAFRVLDGGVFRALLPAH